MLRAQNEIGWPLNKPRTRTYQMKTIIRFLSIAITSIGLFGCASNSDGTVSMGVKGSPAWHDNAPRKDVQAYYDAMPAHELCILWAEKRNRSDVRKEISESLIRRKMNPLYCY